jgi:hypothetical protein
VRTHPGNALAARRPALVVVPPAVDTPPVVPYAPKLLAPGTRVQLNDDSLGTVQHYERERFCVPTMLGLFPVELADGRWCTCCASDVKHVLTAGGPAFGGDHRDANAL